MKFLLALCSVICAAVAINVNNDIEGESTTEYADLITENPLDESTLSPQHFELYDSKRQRRGPIDGLLAFKNKQFYNPMGYKIVWKKDCPGVDPDKITLVPKFLMDVIFGRPVVEAARAARMRVKNTYLQFAGLMIIPMDQSCQGGSDSRGGNAGNPEMRKWLQNFLNNDSGPDSDNLMTYPPNGPSSGNDKQDDYDYEENAYKYRG